MFNFANNSLFSHKYNIHLNHLCVYTWLGTRRIRASYRKRQGWALNERKLEIYGIDERTGEKLFWPGAKNFEYFVVNGEKMNREESQHKLEELMEQALGIVKRGEVENFETITKTEFDPEVVLPICWRPNDAVIWDNTRYLHSTTPVGIYAPGLRIMYQIIYATGDVRRQDTDITE